MFSAGQVTPTTSNCYRLESVKSMTRKEAVAFFDKEKAAAAKVSSADSEGGSNLKPYPILFSFGRPDLSRYSGMITDDQIKGHAGWLRLLDQNLSHSDAIRRAKDALESKGEAWDRRGVKTSMDGLGILTAAGGGLVQLFLKQNFQSFYSYTQTSLDKQKPDVKCEPISLSIRIQSKVVQPPDSVLYGALGTIHSSLTYAKPIPEPDCQSIRSMEAFIIPDRTPEKAAGDQVLIVWGFSDSKKQTIWQGAAKLYKLVPGHVDSWLEGEISPSHPLPTPKEEVVTGSCAPSPAHQKYIEAQPKPAAEKAAKSTAK